MNEVSVLYYSHVDGISIQDNEEFKTSWERQQLESKTAKYQHPAIVLVYRPTSSNMLPRIGRQHSVLCCSGAQRSASAKPVSDRLHASMHIHRLPSRTPPATKVESGWPRARGHTGKAANDKQCCGAAPVHWTIHSSDPSFSSPTAS